MIITDKYMDADGLAWFLAVEQTEEDRAAIAEALSGVPALVQESTRAERPHAIPDTFIPRGNVVSLAAYRDARKVA